MIEFSEASKVASSYDPWLVTQDMDVVLGSMPSYVKRWNKLRNKIHQPPKSE
jgi:hypothetical protein